ncbi:MAG: hypothetical protein PW845_07320 [Pseudomonas sp.]|uniref:DUF7693 family protein n=1 Tax=Pseudomonas abieticivorans TaxID=2931382 RepID=UPI0020BFB4B4|nr:hypothetical protein [Pseudomonas sp. PIA16]MDE1165194.1 hypothetical protein [Pseudomonas sp.]
MSGADTTATPPALTAREVCQVLREAIFGRRTLTNACHRSRDETDAGVCIVEIDGWRLSIDNEGDALGHCEQCTAADGRTWAFNSGDRYGTDPIAMLSQWEHTTLERLLKQR